MDEESGFEELLEGESPGKFSDGPGVEKGGLQSALKAQIDDAVDYAESDLAHDRLSASSAYRGDGLDTDEDLDATRSRVISRDVHDVVHAIMPSLLRVFFSGRDVVEFTPEGPEDEGWAQQATDYVNKIVLGKDNDGFMICFSAFKDCLIKGLGVFKWWWDDDYHVEAHEYSGLDQATFQVLAGDPSVSEIYNFEQDPEFGMISCTVARKVSKGGYARVEAVPPEERLIDRSARSIKDSTFYGHRRKVTVSDLVAMGFDFEQVSQLGGAENMDTNEEKVERYDNQVYQDSVVVSDPSLRTLEFVEAYMRIDLDADGVAELYKISCGGTAYQILNYTDGEQAVELVDGIPFAEICPDPEPHLATGHSISEQVEDIQKIKSGLLRGTLDSLSRSIFPREEVVEQQVNMDDVLNPEIGATIRVKAPGMVREIATSFMGRDCLPVLEYFDEIKADRTGVSDTTQGLNPKDLQSTTDVGVQAAVTASQSQIEMVARIIAQSGMTHLFKGLLMLIKTNQDQMRTVKLRNNWVQVDPRSWNAGMDACVNVALGHGSDSDKMGMLNMVAEKQELAMTTLGPNNPLATMVEYRNTLAEMVTLAGYYNPDKFFLPVEHSQVMQQMKQELDQAKQEAQEATEMSRNLEYELRNHRVSEDVNKDADSVKKGAEALKTVVEAVQLADQDDVDPDAAKDEAVAAGKYIQ